jgi:putative salt-induced outer membrane protein YdiY
LNHVAAVTAKISTLLSLKVSHTTRFVNFPPPGFDKTDTITAVALVAKF